jgi:hypothetical protein
MVVDRYVHYHRLVSFFTCSRLAASRPEDQPHAYDTWSPQSSNGPFSSTTAFDQPSALKRDYSRGHQLDERFEEDKLKLVARERRLLGAGAAVGVAMAVVAGWKALTG